MTTATTAKKPGRKSAADIRAEIEAEVRAEVEREAREKIEAEVRAQVEQEIADEKAAKAAIADALDTKPINGLDISADPKSEGAIIIHFVEDGFTVLGKVWYRGEELSLAPGTPEWEKAPTYNGKIFALMDEYEQEERWGRRMFRSGPWRGKRLTEIEDPELNEAERAALAKAEKIREVKFGNVN